MRRFLLVLAAAMLLACTSTPTPSPPTAPSPSPIAVALDCGPLTSAASCAAAVEVGIRIKDPAIAWSSIRIVPPDKTCVGATGPCRAPQVVVRFFSADPSVSVADVGLVSTGGGWVYIGQIR